MSNETIIRAWKDPEFRKTLGSDALANIPSNPAGYLAVELNENELANIVGGSCGSGAIPSWTGECTCTNGFTVCTWSKVLPACR